MSNWLSDSIMAKKGEANGKQNSSHSITEDSQGKYHYVLGAYAEPVLTVDPGALISVETHDAFEGKIEKETDKPSEILNVPYLNPQNGPIFVNGARKRGYFSCLYKVNEASRRTTRRNNLFNFRIWWASWNQRYSDA